MSTSIEEAAQALVPALRDQVDAFAGADERNFFDGITLLHVAEAAITIFAGGVAGGAGQTFGKEIATKVIDAIKRAMHGDTPADPAADQAIAAARQVPAPERDANAAKIEAELSHQLTTMLSTQEAASLAAKVRQQALLVIA